tara:strand:- start:423 stop:1265 length:843 start_codon:yes stop_codon:yes gene_type:complete
MIDSAVIAAIITGICGCGLLILQNILDMNCIKNENFDGSIKKYYCIPRFNNCSYPIPDNDIDNVLKIYREPPNNWSLSNAIYTKKTKNDEYLIIVQNNLYMKTEDNKWQGSVIWYREFDTKSSTNIWYLETILDNIKNNKYVKLCVKRFSNTNTNNWKFLETHSEYISAHNGRNYFETDSKIGDILEEEEIIYDENNNPVKINKAYECTHEQIGIVLYSISNNDLIIDNINCCNKLDQIVSIAIESNFSQNIISEIKSNKTTICLIKKIYIGEESLYILN